MHKLQIMSKNGGEFVDTTFCIWYNLLDISSFGRGVSNTARKFAKIAAVLCAVVFLGVAFAAAAPHTDPILTANAAQPSYDMSDAYKASNFYKNFISVTLTGDQRKDVISIALSQLGYHEGNSVADFGGESKDGVRDFVEYNVMSGQYDNGQGNGVSYGYYWCASFVNWCLRQAGVSKDASAGAEISCQRWVSACSNAGIFKSRGSYIPKSGDMIFFRDKGSAAASTHIGLVLYVDAGQVYTVEGNTSFTNDYSSDGEYVALKHYSLDSDYIVGYGCPMYNTESSYKRVDYSGELKTKGQYIPHGRVTLYSDEDKALEIGEIDAFTLFDVAEIRDGALAVNASVGGTKLSGYIDADADVVQVTAVQDLFIVSYTDKDGSMMFYPQYCTSGQQKKIYSNKPQKDGCGFVGWQYKKADGSTVIYPAAAELPAIDCDVTLTAVFDSTFYLVSFQMPDKTLISQSYGYYGTTVNIPDAPSAPEGYVFVGWSAEVSSEIMGNATYTAVFEEITDTESSYVIESESQTKEKDIVGCNAGVAFPAIAILPLAAIGFFFRKKNNRTK